MAEPAHVVLIGMMGTGKTSIGRPLAARLGRPFVDSDEQVERLTGRTVKEIFEADGEAAYRRLESRALATALAEPEPAVVAAAGGVVIDPANRQLLREAGTVIWLDAPPAVLAERVVDGDHRPLLGDDPLGTLTRLLAARADWYREVADAVVDVGSRTEDEVVDAVLDVLRRAEVRPS